MKAYVLRNFINKNKSNWKHMGLNNTNTLLCFDFFLILLISYHLRFKLNLPYVGMPRKSYKSAD